MDIKKYYEKLAKNMRVERAKRKISQLNLATKAGISLDTVNMIERGVAKISIAKALDVDLNTLIPIK